MLINIVNQSQATFVLGQHIHDHILLAYELIKGYTKKGGTPGCMLQLDLEKSYDTLYKKDLENILKETSFPSQFTRWIMLVVTIVS